MKIKHEIISHSLAIKLKELELVRLLVKALDQVNIPDNATLYITRGMGDDPYSITFIWDTKAD